MNSLDLFLQLIEKLKELLELRGSKRREYYNTVVVPLLSEFETLHNSYLERLQNFRNVIKNSPSPFSPSHVREKVAEDILFKSHKSKNFAAKVTKLREYPRLAVAMKQYVSWGDWGFQSTKTDQDRVLAPIISQRFNIGRHENICDNAAGTFYTIMDKDKIAELARESANHLRDLFFEDNQKAKSPERKSKKVSKSKKSYIDNAFRQTAIYQLDKIVGELQKRYLLVLQEFRALT